MKYILNGLLMASVSQAVRLQREPISVTAAQSNLADPYTSTELMRTQEEVRDAKVEMGIMQSKEDQKLQMQAYKDNTVHWTAQKKNQLSEYEQTFVDTEGRKFFPVHTPTSLNFEI